MVWIAMTFKLEPLPYPKSALEPAISARTMDFHYGKHHAGYVDKLNKLTEGTPYATLPLEQVIQKAAQDAKGRSIFNNAAQVWNHDLFWRSMTADGGGAPNGRLRQQLETDFGSIEGFAKQFLTQAVGLFGSGWTWLVSDGKALRIISTANAETPMTSQQHALLACDVWEHAYYLDYQNNREAFVHAFLEKLANWQFATDRLAMLSRDQEAETGQQPRRRAR
jgi:Fe-Mn family superoxide dismutase